MRRVLLLVDVENGVDVDPILHLAERADLVILSRNGTGRGTSSSMRKLTALANIVTTRGVEPWTIPTFSAFNGGTLRPVESLESILRREKVREITVFGGNGEVTPTATQTAFDANALGYGTSLCAASIVIADLEQFLRAGIEVKSSEEIWTVPHAAV